MSLQSHRALARALLRYQASKRPLEERSEPNPTRQAISPTLDKCDPSPNDDGVVLDLFGNEANNENVVYIKKGNNATDYACYARESLQELFLNNVVNKIYQRPEVPGLSRPFTELEEASIFPGLEGEFFLNDSVSPNAKYLIFIERSLHTMLFDLQQRNQSGEDKRRDIQAREHASLAESLQGLRPEDRYVYDPPYEED